MTAQEQQILDTMQEAMKSQAESLRILTEQSAKKDKMIESLEQQVKELTAQLAWFQRQMFGRKSEKLAAIDPNQLSLFGQPEIPAEVQQAQQEATAQIEKETPEDKKVKRQNRKMIEDLPVLKREIIEPEGIDLTVYKKIGEEVTRVVEFEPGKLYIREIIRPKYGLRNPMEQAVNQVGIMIAPMPMLPIFHGIAAPSLLSEVLLQKYEYHVPFYRQAQQFRHLGLKVSDKTIDGWFRPTATMLEPLYKVLVEEVFRSWYLQSDETTTPVVDHEKEKAVKEYLWMIRAVQERLRIFYYEEGSRAGEVIKGLAEKNHFKGYVQCDGYTGYETAFRNNPDVQLVNCMAHIRRHFEAALGENKEAAEHAIAEIQKLYNVEHICDKQGLSADERKQKRQELALPIMNGLKAWMETEGLKYSQSSLMGKAVTYAYTRWDNMMRYLEDGRLLIDNNLAENAIRPITLGRKNYLFCGNHEAAGHMSIVCSLIGTCKEQQVNPRLWLNDIITRLPAMTKATREELLQLLPQNWKHQHPDALLQTTEN